MSAQRYSGGCQCGAVRYHVDGVDLDSTVSCNCSRCGRIGSVLAFVPVEAFQLESGEASLTEYQFNKHIISHFFCKTCGVQPFSRGRKPDGTTMIAVNARCLDGVNVHELKPRQFDGRSL